MPIISCLSPQTVTFCEGSETELEQLYFVYTLFPSAFTSPNSSTFMSDQEVSPGGKQLLVGPGATKMKFKTSRGLSSEQKEVGTFITWFHSTPSLVLKGIQRDSATVSHLGWAEETGNYQAGIWSAPISSHWSILVSQWESQQGHCLGEKLVLILCPIA